MAKPNPVKIYLRELAAQRATGVAGEHAYRPALKTLLEELRPGVRVVNDARRIACGAPDLVALRDDLPVGYVECKDIGISLDEAEKSAQLQRYLATLPNLILTDYCRFIYYRDGEVVREVRLAKLDDRQRVKMMEGAEDNFRQLLESFLTDTGVTVSTPQDLAGRMARITHMIRDVIIQAYERNEASPLLREWREAFARVLIAELDQPEHTAEFADMIAQTIAYGLFSARVMGGGPKTFTRGEAQRLIPKSNPFLRDFFYQLTGPRLDDEPFASFVDDLVRLLARTNMSAVLADFGKRTRQEDPVVHFYETFLAAYDPKLREARGVYYTPEPVVSYITRAVDSLLTDHFGCADGLMDHSKITVPVLDPGNPQPVMRELHRVLVLDFACGTATFLYNIIDMIRRKHIERNDVGSWPGYVREHLLPRIFGFELLMAPYAVAHFKLSLQLAARDLPEPLRKQLAYIPGDGERIGVYLTNTLEEAHDIKGLPLFTQWVADETNRANAVKRQLPIMVVTGNPPYSNFGMMNKNEWISGLLQDYKKGLDEKKLNLDDDFIKFLRFGQWRIDQTGRGILAVITSNTYLDGLTHRRMRESLLNSFTDIYILDLHGSSKKKESGPDGDREENVFDIQQGVAIAIFVKEPGKPGPATVHHADLWGKRADKYAWLNENDLKTTKWTKLKPEGEHFFFVPKDMKTGNEYLKWWGVKDIFHEGSSGVQTERDDLSIHWTQPNIEAVVEDFRKLDEHQIREKYNLGDDSRDWKVATAKADVCEHRAPGLFRKILYRPFDTRHTWYSGQTRGFIGTPGYPLMKHMLAGENLALLTLRQSRRDETGAFFIGRGLVGKDCVSSFDRGTVFPLYVLQDNSQKKWKLPAGTMLLFEDAADYAVRAPNLDPKFIAEFAKILTLEWQPSGPGDLAKTFGTEDVFHYIYAVLHSPTYRERYAEFLKIDFPRIPPPADSAQFRTLCGLGKELAALHLMEAPALAKPGAAFPVAGGNEVAKGFPKYAAEQCRVHINAEQYFAGVPPEIWEFRVGGYQVCEKWLKDRRGRTLDFNDLTHYRQIITALRETRRLMAEVDHAVPAFA